MASSAWLPFSSPVDSGSMQTKRRRGFPSLLLRTLPRCSLNGGRRPRRGCPLDSGVPPRCRGPKRGRAQRGYLLVPGVLPMQQVKWRHGKLVAASACFSCALRLGVDESHGKRGARRQVNAGLRRFAALSTSNPAIGSPFACTSRLKEGDRGKGNKTKRVWNFQK